MSTRFASGLQSGAWLLTDDHERRAVLKWQRSGSRERLGNLAVVVDRLRARGYPTPAWLATGTTAAGIAYYVQEFARGHAVSPLTLPTARRFIKVLEQQAGADPDHANDRSADVARSATDDSAGGYRHAVRHLGRPGAALIAAYDAVVEPYMGTRLPGGDMVHGDFNTCNVLLEQGRVSAVIDLDDLGSGTRVIDYACLLREAYVDGDDEHVRRQLRRSAEEIAGPGVLAICTSRQVDLSGRRRCDVSRRHYRRPMAYTFQVTFDSADPHAAADWWAAALGWDVEPSDEEFIRRMIAEGHATEDDTTTHNGVLVWKEGAAILHPEGKERAPRILFQLVPEPKTVKNRVHLDVRVGSDDVDEVVQRLIGAGATCLHNGRQGPHTWVTIADPEGNELCVSP